MISEFDLRRRDHALLDVIARRREAYHAALTEGAQPEEAHSATNIHGAVRVKEAGLAELLWLDRYRRGGLQEWLLDEGASVDEFARGHFASIWEPVGAWEHSVEKNKTGASVRLVREANGLRISKRIEVPASGESVGIEYEAASTRDEPARFAFVSEWSLSPPQSPDGDDRTSVLEIDGRDVDMTVAAGAEAGVRCFAVRGSAAYALECEADKACDVWHFPVETVSSSEGGLERVPQGVSVSLVRHLDVAPGTTVRFGFRWHVVGALTP